MDMKQLTRQAEEYLKLETDAHFREDLQKVLEREDFESLNDRFYTQLSFGTGGLRGMIGGGFNRMNPFVVRRATQGLANYVKREAGVKEPKAVIAYDSRHFSSVFAEEAALVFCANGIKTYLFTSLRPTPELSFAIRRLEATTGIVVTASHNPPAYNGYKVYWSDGAQIIHPHDTGIIEEVQAVSSEIRSMNRKEALEGGMLVLVDREIDDAFVDMVKSYSLRPELIRSHGHDLRVVYTPLHGAGRASVERVLGELGIEVITVPQQREPDGDFPTVEYPNPEEASALKLALDLGRREKADLVMGTDPDSDRLGIAVPGSEDFVLITGNQLGALLADYRFSTLEELGRMPERPAFVKTIVTTNLQRRIAESHGATVYDVLTGFKYIADMIRRFEITGESYIFGAEESYGFLVETEVRDKDAVSAALLAAEMALYHRSKEKSVLDALNELYDRYGYYEELLISRGFSGETGTAKMKQLMDRLRNDPPKTIGGVAVERMKDYQASTTTVLAESGKNDVSHDIDLPASNVLQFLLTDDTIVTVRPSGTEPKIKFYASACTNPGTPLAQARTEMGAKMKAVEEEIDSIIAAVT